MLAIVKSLCFSLAILVSFATLFAVVDAVRFNVGGDGVWVVNPKENYNTWAERNRFQVNDTLYFKYAKGSDSVQQVMKADYDYCNTRNPLKSFDNGESVVKFDRSGPFYFISGNEDHCKKGQKLIIVVLAIRNHHPTVPVSPAKPPSMPQPPKSPSPVSPIAPAKPPSTAHPPKSPAAPLSPPSKSQPPKSSFSPAQSPQAPSPVSHSPALSPSHAPTQSPMSQSPSPKSPTPASSPSPSSPSPDQSPTTSPAEQTPTSSPSPSEANPSPDTVMAPAPTSRNSTSGVAVTSVMTAVLGLAFTVLMFV